MDPVLYRHEDISMLEFKRPFDAHVIQAQAEKGGGGKERSPRVRNNACCVVEERFARKLHVHSRVCTKNRVRRVHQQAAIVDASTRQH